METIIPPSYEEATAKDPWELVAAYITGSDLCEACLVSKRWHAIFAPWLWGNPAGHFGTENDRVYVTLTRFKRALPTASLQVRQLTHTLRLPPAVSEIYDGPKAEWLRDVLEQLPCLQSLIVSQLPFFDHSALLALRRRGRYNRTENNDEPITFPLRLLVASRCTNATSTGLVETCLRMPHLVFLDLSWTSAAREPTLFQALHAMRRLQVLKLSGIGLRDADLSMIAESIRLRVRSLDVSFNKLTDVSVQTLLKRCFHPSRDVHSLRARERQTNAHEDWPAGMQRPEDVVWHQFRDFDLDDKFVKHLTQPDAVGILAEDLPVTGLTHLYISSNFVTVEGLSSLIKTENLHVLDASDIDTVKSIRHSHASGWASLAVPLVPGVEKLGPILEAHGRSNLTYLRIHHSLVTDTTDSEYQSNPVFEIDGLALGIGELEANGITRAELPEDDVSRYELEVASPVYELAVGTDTPRYELPAESLYTRRPVPTQPHPEDEDPVNRGAVFAPEAVQADRDAPVLSATGFNTYTNANMTSEAVTPGARHSLNGPSQLPRGPASEAMKREEICSIEGRRNAMRQHPQGHTRSLLPGSLPALRVLVLTDVPPFEDDGGKVIAALTKFIGDCAVEAQLARSQATLELPTLYVPGRPRFLHQQHRARELFALSQIVLEMAPASTRPRLDSGSDGARTPTLPPTSPSYEGFRQRERSSTGDPDSEAFWRAAEHDFSFFDDEECGLPVREPDRPLRPTREEKISLAVTTEPEPLSPLSPQSLRTTATSPTTLLSPGAAPGSGGGYRDVVAELAAWRRAQKAASKQTGTAEGHWRGDIRIVRTPPTKRWSHGAKK